MPRSRNALPFGTRYRSLDVTCPTCGEGTIVRHWADVPGPRSGHPDTWDDGDSIDYPNTPCDQCGETEAL